MLKSHQKKKPYAAHVRLSNHFEIGGTGGRNRTDKELPPADFESAAFTNFTTPAHRRLFM